MSFCAAWCYLPSLARSWCLEPKQRVNGSCNGFDGAGRRPREQLACVDSRGPGRAVTFADFRSSSAWTHRREHSTSIPRLQCHAFVQAACRTASRGVVPRPRWLSVHGMTQRHPAVRGQRLQRKPPLAAAGDQVGTEWQRDRQPGRLSGRSENTECTRRVTGFWSPSMRCVLESRNAAKPRRTGCGLAPQLSNGQLSFRTTARGQLLHRHGHAPHY